MTQVSDEQSTDLTSTAQLLTVLEEKFASIPAPTLRELTVEQVESKSRRAVQLIGNQDPSKSYSAKSEWIGYEFQDVLFISEIVVRTVAFSEYDDFELSFEDAFSKEKKSQNARSEGNVFNFKVDRFLAGVGIRPPTKFWKQGEITGIDIICASNAQLGLMVSQLTPVTKLRDRIVGECNAAISDANSKESQVLEHEQELRELEASIEKQDQFISGKKKEIEGLENSKAGLSKELEIKSQLIAERDSSIKSLEDQIEKRTSERSVLSTEVAKSQSKLSELQRDIHLFPSEIAGYVKQGSRNAWLYAGLCLVPFAVMCLVTAKLFANSEQLLNVFLSDRRPPVGEYLLSRMPYALVSAVILTVCYTMLHRLFSEIVAINRRKQDLLKVSIIATDVSFASQHGLDLDTKTEYHLRTQTKMELLKEHLKQHLSDDFTYGKGNTILQRLLEAARRRLDSPQTETQKATQED